MTIPSRGRSRVVLIGTSVYLDPNLPDIPAVKQTVEDLAKALTDQDYGVVAGSNCIILENEGDIRLVGRRLRSAASQAEELLLVYYAGHGLVSGRRHELYLGLPDSEWGEPEFNSLEYDKLRAAVLDSPAKIKIIILDCCFSGRAVGNTMTDSVAEIVGQMDVAGTYVLTSAQRDQVALVLEGEQYTAFTGRLIRLLQNGISDGPEFLTIDDLYHRLLAIMKAEGLSRPQKRATMTADFLPLARNRAFGALAQVRFSQQRNAAAELGKSGAWSRSAEVLGELLDEQEHVLGLYHKDTQQTRQLLAGAIRSRRLLADAVRSAANPSQGALESRQGGAVKSTARDSNRLHRSPFRHETTSLRGRVIRLIATAAAIVGVSFAGIYTFRYFKAEYPSNYSGNGYGSVIFQVVPGQTPSSIAPRLVKAGVVASSQAFVLAAKAAPPTPQLEPGYFKLRKSMNAEAAWKLLVSGNARIQNKVMLAEGLRVSRIVADLGAKTTAPFSAYQAAVKNVAALGLPPYANGHLEGYLYPGTYNIQPGTSATQVLRMMVTRFKQEASDLHLQEAAKAAQVSENHIIIIASLIQAEGGKVSDFPKIAEVIYQRLNHNAKLELDSTVEYALGKYGIAATNQQIQTPSPYNTYVHTGLPPGPIDSPGQDAIQAALHPAHGNLFYFVTVDPKQHITKFTSSAAEFAKLRQELERNLARGG